MTSKIGNGIFLTSEKYNKKIYTARERVLDFP